MLNTDLMLRGLKRLADHLKRKEINFGIAPAEHKDSRGRTVRDVPFLQAVNTPDASQIVCDAKGRYDAWSPDGSEIRSSNLTLEQASKLVWTEYCFAKVARIKERDPTVNVDKLMRTLERGYQRKT